MVVHYYDVTAIYWYDHVGYLLISGMAIITFKTVKSFTQFLWNWKIGGSQLVDQNTANIRATICSACHNNQLGGDIKSKCGVCNKMGNKALDSIRDDIISGNRTPTDMLLNTCGICGCDLKISVWIPNSILLSVSDANAYPEFCWKKKVLDNQDL